MAQKALFARLNQRNKMCSQCIWNEIGLFYKDESAIANRNRVVFSTKNGKLFFSLRPVDSWLIEKYAIDRYIILPEV